MAAAYPTGLKLFIDDEDITYWVFGDDTFEINDIDYRFTGIDLSPYCSEPGEHRLEITCESGVGRVEARLEIE
jgi:hypothetical protein